MIDLDDEAMDLYADSYHVTAQRMRALRMVSLWSGLSISRLIRGMNVRADGWIHRRSVPHASARVLVVYRSGVFQGGWGVAQAYYHADHHQYTLCGAGAGGVVSVCLWRPLPDCPALPADRGFV